MGEEDLVVEGVAVTKLKINIMKINNIKTSLAIATTAVMGTVHASDSILDRTDFNGALLFYSETDRVTAVEAVFDTKYYLKNDDVIGLKITVDSLTGASANGAITSDVAQTFTTPSGNSSYTTEAGETPLDDTFLDTRFSISPSWTRRWNSNYKSTVGVNLSKEYDYFSLSSNALVSYNTDDNNRIYTAGVTLAHDTINPEGDIPIAFGIMQNVGAIQPRNGSDDTRLTADLLLGVTQVIDSRSLLQINYSASASDGYHSDPFKVLSIIGADGRPVIESTNSGLSRVVFENRPDSRLKHSIYFQYKRDMFDGDVLDSSYRYMIDDWGVTSHTLDLKYKYRINGESYLQPHVRLYQQSEADFYQPFIISGQEPTAGDNNSFASADYRLGDLTGYTFGLEYGRDNVGRPWSIALEYYLQNLGDTDGAFGALNEVDTSESVSAIMFRFNMDF